MSHNIDPLTCSWQQWFDHCTERLNYWQSQRDSEHNRSMVALWTREKILAWQHIAA